MSFDIFRDPRGPYKSVSVVQPDAISIGDAKRISHAFAIGDGPLPDYRKPHRGMLPDIDFSQVAIVPKRSLLKRIVQALRLAHPEPQSPGEAAPDPRTTSVAIEGRSAATAKVIPFRHAA